MVAQGIAQSRARSRGRAVTASLLLILGFALATCSKAPLVAPSGSTINLVATTNVLPVNGSTDITAVVIEAGSTSTTGGTTTTSGGTPVHDGTLVSFTTSLGTIQPANAHTNNGAATVRLIASGESGVATITAYSGAATKTLTLNIGAAAAARILVSANPQSLPPTGGVSTIVANVQDGQGNGIAGVPVNFAVTTGTGTLSNGLVVTDNSGTATTQLTATANTTVTASASGGTGAGSTLSGTVNITLQPNSTISITPPTGVVTVSTTTTLSVTVGANVIATDVLVNFGDGEKIDLGALTSTAQNVPHIYGGVGSFTATATATFADGSVKTASTPVIVTDFDVTIACGGNVAFGATSTFTATVTPAGVSISDFAWQIGGETGAPVLHGSTATYTWQSRGTKSATLTVFPTKGPTKTRVCQLEVN
jgi:hypothetical protein